MSQATEYFILYRGEWYDISRFDTFEGYKADIQIYASRMKNKPSGGEIVEYQG